MWGRECGGTRVEGAGCRVRVGSVVEVITQRVRVDITPLVKGNPILSNIIIAPIRHAPCAHVHCGVSK